jgi:polar amino acid transport system permease protein
MHRPIRFDTDLPVLNLAALDRLRTFAATPSFNPTLLHALLLVTGFIASIGIAQAQAASGHPSVLATLLKWSPLILKGFVFNIAISFLAMAIGTFFGMFLGLAQISLMRPVRKGAAFATHFFRNAPWLVLLFYCMFLLPF